MSEDKGKQVPESTEKEIVGKDHIASAKIKSLTEDALRPEELTKDAPKETPTATTTVTNYEYGDLTIKCGICGHEHIIDTNVKGGITIVLPTTKEHKLQLTCEKCEKSDMSIYFQDAANPPIEDAEVVKEDKLDSDIKPEDVKLTVVKDKPESEDTFSEEFIEAVEISDEAKKVLEGTDDESKEESK